MISTDLILRNTYSFEIIKESEAKKYFRVRTEDGVEYTLPKFKFQINKPLPDFLICYVKSLNPTILCQDIAAIINQFYTSGKEYDFIVKADRTESNKYYELEDEHGLCFKLINAPLPLSKGNNIKCRVVSIKGKNVTLKYVGKLSLVLPLKFYTIAQWLDAVGADKHYRIYNQLLRSVPELRPAMEMYGNGDPSWIIEILRLSSVNITIWLIKCKEDLRALTKVYNLLLLAEKIALYILEESDYLSSCNHDQRLLLQSRLSNIVELFRQYGAATSKILSGSHTDYIDKMFLRLKNAGYLYHPSKQFRIMMTILKLRPELINSRMGELFEALHSWDITNWRTDPFRPALVEQLQIFIEENSAKVNQLPANDLSSDNKTIIRLILAIAIQRLLATDDDKIDLNINRARLYRYISYLFPDKASVLLNKSMEALLGIDFPNEFSWQDTDRPTLLFEKSSHPVPDSEERRLKSKIYSTAKADVKLRIDGLKIVAKNADEDSTVIPANLLDTPATTIALADQIQIKNLRKSQNTKTYQQMWNDISWSIFGEADVDDQEPVKYEKHQPYGGEEVKIIIDDMRVTNSGPEKQRLQFHCTICDEMFKGDGWMPCDAIHMISWLSSKDIPGNYNGSLDFARNRDGQPLIFTANVYRKSWGLEFNMKSQIDSFLLETSSPEKELIGIITYFDRINNAWLCLTEMGSTFKIFYDESTSGLCEGQLVRVRYIEAERMKTLTQFFIGELSSNQEDIPVAIKKSFCLYNLMHAIGEDPNEPTMENLEVRETEEVMSREELLELIYLYQRRAYAESEYLKAYNYLGLASILCKIADAPQLKEELSLHMQLICLLQDFGKNQNIDVEDLYEFQDDVCKIPMLERLYKRLKIVADIGTNEEADWLWDLSKNPRNETEGRLASMVLSYNMLPKEMEDTRKEIMTGITTLMNVNSANPSSKYYGDESQTVEFKSSMIYSSRSGSSPDPKGQMHEIIHIICGFLNARGGTLYIGVNDSGYECGLTDDLAYRKAQGLKYTLDSLCVELTNNLSRTLPSYAIDRCSVSIDKESKKGVISVEILPVETPVELDGIIYVRSSSTTKPRLGEEREEFIRHRSENYHLFMRLLGYIAETEEEEETESEDNIETSVVDDQPDEVKINSLDNTSRLNANKKIERKTNAPVGKLRHNVLHYYDNNFITPSYYLYIESDNLFYRSDIDLYIEEKENCLAVLAVKEHELESRLIVAYEDGSVIKLPMKKISTLATNVKSNLYQGKAIKHVNIGSDEDYLLSVIYTFFGEIYYRIDSLTNIHFSNDLNETGLTLCMNTHTILEQEIISADKLSLLDPEALDMDPKYYGVKVPTKDGTLSHEERINLLFQPLFPTE